MLRSYATGAAHMALSWVSREGIAVDDDGAVHDLTIRSFGVLRAVDTPPIEVEITPSARRAGARRRRRVRRRGGRRLAPPRLPDRLADRRPLALTDCRPMSKPVGPYTPIVRAGEWLVVSGQVGIADGKLVAGGLEAELRQAIANLEGLLASEGASLTTSPRPPCSSSTSAPTTPG